MSVLKILPSVLCLFRLKFADKKAKFDGMSEMLNLPSWGPLGWCINQKIYYGYVFGWYRDSQVRQAINQLNNTVIIISLVKVPA